MDMNCLPKIFLNNQNEFRSVGTPTDRKMLTANDNQAISIYPNPASTYITIAYKSQTDGYFKLYNALGEVVMQTQLSALNTKVQLILSDVANGVYHYDILFLDGQQSKGKLLIQKK